MRVAWGVVRLLALVAAVAAARLAISETMFRADKGQSVRRAIAIEDSAAFEERLAELDTAHAREALERAVAIDPRASGAWIALGMLQETENDAGTAERSLLRAARVDRQFLPAWTLCNFYFRRGNREKFWLWAPRAASLTYDDFRPLLGLCEQFEADPVRLLEHFGDAPRIREPFLDFLIGERRLDAALQVARGMMWERANDPRLIDLADRLLRAGDAASAMELWNAASGLGRLDPAEGRILTNGDLARAPLNLGFDWRLRQTEGVAEDWRPTELVFTFSGSEPESGELLAQTILLVPRRFRLRFDYLTGETAPMGVRWGLEQTAGPVIEPSAHWKEGTFDLPRTRGIARLKLLYRREPGTTRAEGRIEIRNLRLEETS